MSFSFKTKEGTHIINIRESCKKLSHVNRRRNMNEAVPENRMSYNVKILIAKNQSLMPKQYLTSSYAEIFLNTISRSVHLVRFKIYQKFSHVEILLMYCTTRTQLKVILVPGFDSNLISDHICKVPYSRVITTSKKIKNRRNIE